MSHLFRDNFRVWWQVPRNAAEETKREVSFLELFYDLVYVVIIAEVAHHLAAHLSWTGFGQFIFLFMFVIWAWINGMYYHELHGQNDISIRVFTFIQMLIVGAMAVFAGDALSSGADGFAISFGIFQLFFTYVWLRTGRFDPEHARLSYPTSAFYFLTALAMFASTTLEQPAQFYVWGGVLGLALIMPLVSYLNSSTRSEAVNSNRLSLSSIERFGLITIIVLGEVVVSAIRGAASLDDFVLRTGLVLSLGMLVAIALWWVYFDFISRRKIKKGHWANQAYSYLHMPLLLSIAGAGAVLLYMIEHSNDLLSDQTRWMFVIFLATAVISIALLLRTVDYERQVSRIIQKSSKIMLLCALLLLALGFTGSGVVATLAVSIIILLFPVYYGVRSWLKLQVSQ